MCLFRKTSISVSTRYFSFRWEIYNVLNHQNQGIPNTNWCLPPLPRRLNGSSCISLVASLARSPTFKPTPAMQFGLKFYW